MSMMFIQQARGTAAWSVFWEITSSIQLAQIETGCVSVPVFSGGCVNEKQKGYTVRKITWKGKPAWQVITPEGHVSNDYNFPTYALALQHKRVNEELFGTKTDEAQEEK